MIQIFKGDEIILKDYEEGFLVYNISYKLFKPLIGIPLTVSGIKGNTFTIEEDGGVTLLNSELVDSYKTELYHEMKYFPKMTSKGEEELFNLKVIRNRIKDELLDAFVLGDKKILREKEKTLVRLSCIENFIKIRGHLSEELLEELKGI